MQSQNEKTGKKYEMAAQFIQILANIAVILGIIFAVVQIHQTKQIESVQLAVDATSPTRTTEFLESYRKLMDAYNIDHDMMNTDSLRGDLNLVVNVYDNIAILYLHNLADREILEARVYDGMAKLVPVLETKKWPTKSRSNFDAALALMSSHHTNTESTNTQNERNKQ